MAQPYVGEIRLFGGNFAPNGWLFCDGSLQPISQYEVLFNLIGTTYGGDGLNTFALPDLRGRVPVHRGQGPGLSPWVIGEQMGAEQTTLTAAQMPAHTHVLRGSTAAAAATSPANAVLAATTAASYDTGAAATLMADQAVQPVGGTQPHDNMAPFGVVSFIISLYGIFPSQS